MESWDLLLGSPGYTKARTLMECGAFEEVLLVRETRQEGQHG